MQGLECRLALSEALGDEGIAYCHQTYSKQRVLISALKSALSTPGKPSRVTKRTQVSSWGFRGWNNPSSFYSRECFLLLLVTHWMEALSD